MKKVLATLALSLAATAPALAADAPTAGPATSINALLDGGYEFKQAVPISDADQKIIWPNDPVAPYMMLIFQKGPSLASCTLYTRQLVSMTPSTLDGATVCHKR